MSKGPRPLGRRPLAK